MLGILNPELKKCSLVFLRDLIGVMKSDGISPFDIKDILRIYFFVKEQNMLGRSFDEIGEKNINEIQISSGALKLVDYNMSILDECKAYQDYMKEYDK